ncbi:MAG TPA: tryptophan dimethylallyltransferase family protein [Polyangiaceae bacterium]
MKHAVSGAVADETSYPSPPSSRPPRSRPPSTNRTYAEVSASQLEALARALGWNAEELQRALDVQDRLFRPWSRQEIPRSAPYPSLIGDDHSPYEYSLAFNRSNVELRILLEAQADVPSARGNLEAAEALNTRLVEHFGVDLSRLNQVRHLFLDRVSPPFSLWHAVCLNPGRSPEFKIYLNPAVRGASAAPALIDEALTRLGFGSATLDVLKRFARRGTELDEIRYFSLDLSSDAHARVKVYFAHPGATALELDSAFEVAPTHRRGDVLEFCDVISRHHGPFDRKPVTSCLAFVAGQVEPTAVTLHLPIAHYAENDEIIRTRVTEYLAQQGLNRDPYARALQALANRPLATDVGTQSYASFRREKTGIRFTAYLSPELFGKKGSKRTPVHLRSIGRDPAW